MENHIEYGVMNSGGDLTKEADSRWMLQEINVYRTRAQANDFATELNENRTDEMRAAVGTVIVRKRIVVHSGWVDMDTDNAILRKLCITDSPSE